MAQKRTSSSGKPPDPPASALKRFGGYKKEESQRSSSPSVREDASFHRIAAIFRKSFEGASSIWDIYDQVRRILRYESQSVHTFEVERFSLAMGPLNDFPEFPIASGIFLSSLITHGVGREFTVHTSHLPPLEYFGYKLHGKSVTVEGHLGGHAGHEMGRDSISKRCRMLIRGDVGPFLGEEMNGGEIHVNGQISGLGKPHRGRIFQNGELILEK